MLLPDPDHLWYEKYEDNIPGFDTVHELIYEELTKTDLKEMKQGAGKKGKGSATRTFKKVICSNFVTILIMYSITPRELKFRIVKIFKITINFYNKITFTN